jgi:hypothetical protein
MANSCCFVLFVATNDAAAKLSLHFVHDQPADQPTIRDMNHLRSAD